MARTPEALVRAYAKEAAPLERRGERGPEQLPAGAEIMKLDDAGRARAVVEAYRILPPPPRSNAYGKCIMLGLLATTLLRKNLPLGARDLEAMTVACAKAVSPAWGPCDYDAALVKALARAESLTPETNAALRALATRRGTAYAIDRKICASIDALLA